MTAAGGSGPATVEDHTARGASIDATTAQRYALLVDAVEEYAIFMLDPQGCVVTWNAGARRIKGYTAEEILGRHFSTFYPAEDVREGKPERELAQAVEHGRCRDEGWRLRKDGSTFWANVVITALRDDSGVLQGFAKVTRDETDRREAAERRHEIELLTERERIATELCQTLVHHIFEAGLTIQGAAQLVTHPVARARIYEAVDMLDGTLRELRSVVSDLRAPTL